MTLVNVVVETAGLQPAAAADTDYPSAVPAGALPPAPKAAPAVFPPVSVTNDAWVSAQSSTTNSNNDSRLRVASTADATRQGFLKVSLGAVDPRMYVRSARLFLYEEEGFKCQEQVTLGRITSAWSPASVTWATAPTSSSFKSATVSGTYAGPLCGLYDAPESFDVTNVVNGWVSGGYPQYGFRVGIVSGAQRTYISSQSTLTAQRPRLSVSWGWRPDAPTDVRIGPGSPGEVSVESPQISAKLPPAPTNSELQSTRMQIRTVIKDVSTGATVWTGFSPSGNPGARVGVTVPAGSLFNGSTYSVTINTVMADTQALSNEAFQGTFKVDVYTAVVPAPACTLPCFPLTTPQTQSVTLPAGGAQRLQFSTSQLTGENHVGTAWLSVAVPGSASTGGIKVFPDDATEPALPTLPIGTAAQTHTLAIPTVAQDSQLTFVNTTSAPVTLNVTMTAATNGFTMEDEVDVNATDDAESMAAADLEALAASSPGGTSLMPANGEVAAPVDLPMYTSMEAGNSACNKESTSAAAAAAAVGAPAPVVPCLFRVSAASLQTEAQGTDPDAAANAAYLSAVQSAAQSTGGTICRDRIGMGWQATSRWTSCAASPGAVSFSLTGKVVASQKYTIMQRLHTKSTSLDADAAFHLIFGPRFGDALGLNYKIEMGCVPSYTVTGTCDTSHVQSGPFSFQANGTNSFIHRIYSQPRPIGNVSPYSFRLTVVHDNLGEKPPTSGSFSGVRCDNQFRYSGCVIPLWRPNFDRLSLSSPVHPDSARHIQDALNTTRYPALLSREADRMLQEQNRRKAKSMCRKAYGNSRNWQGDCDEYPFAATMQGCAFANGWCSVRLIPASDNRSSGGTLGAWIVSQRVLDAEYYTVEIKP